ncbi:heparin-binding hemagglutinin [Nocardia sp. NPDC055029]|uniref:heparin-binding hemagglutinin n=1 Tax=Nocardia sp. NPDC060259 TaxID=3347088 RepID=UPI003648E458
MTEKTATVTKPLFATVGAGDAIYTAVNEVVADVRERVVATDAKARVDEARERIANVPADVQAQFDTLRERIAGLPSELPEDLAELREKFTSEELRKLAEQYYRQALDIYADLAVRGEETVDRLRANQAVDEQIGRVENLYKDASARAEDALAKVTDLLGRGKAEAEKVADEVVDAEVVAVSTEPAPAEAPAAKAPAAKKAAPAKKAPAKKAAPKKAE